jgi:hypothetical protein
MSMAGDRLRNKGGPEAGAEVQGTVAELWILLRRCTGRGGETSAETGLRAEDVTVNSCSGW